MNPILAAILFALNLIAGPLVPSASLNLVAQSRADTLAKSGSFYHQEFGKWGFKCEGEILARGYNVRPITLIKLWMDSPPHRQVILNPCYEFVGMAMAQDKLRRQYIVILFGGDNG